MSFHTRILVGVLSVFCCAFAGAADPWPFDQRQILLVAGEGQVFPDSLTTAQMMDVFTRKGRVRWVTQKAADGGIRPVPVPKDFPWHSSVAVRNLGLRYKADGVVLLAQRGVQVDLRWYATMDGQPLFFETASLPDAGPRPGEEGARKQRLQDWLGELWAKIPGRGYVVKRDMTTVSLEGAEQEGFKVGDRIEIRRLMEVKRHPLLKTLMSIDSSVSGTAVLTSVGDPFASAHIEYESQTDPIQAGDRYLGIPAKAGVSDAVPAPAAPSSGGTDEASSEPSHFFDVTGRVLLGRFTHQETVGTSTTPLTMKGWAPGFEIDATAYLTREWILGAEMAFAFSSFGGLDTTQFGASSASGNYTNLRVFGGYRVIFLESDEGVGAIELSGGYRRSGLGLSLLSANTAPVSKSFSGINVGFGLSVPVASRFSILFKADRIFGGGLAETPLTGGASTSAVVWNFEGGGRYRLNPVSELSGGISFFRATSTYSGQGTRATPSVSTLLSGTTFSGGYTHKF